MSAETQVEGAPKSEVGGPATGAGCAEQAERQVPQIRCAPEDFVVEEVPLYAPSGEGNHTFVHVEKRLRNTDEVATWLARASGTAPRDIGYAGRKDRVSVARQWFSVPGLDPVVARRLELPGVRVIDAVRHPHKLRTGQLKGNHFEITVRNVAREVEERAELAAQAIRRVGFPNRFGPQRFGRDGDNADRALALLRGRPARDRRRARFWISALQAQVFNRVLDERPHPFDVVEEGDIAVVQESGGLFDVQDVARENPRAAAFEISPTGPIFGTRTRMPTGEPLARELRALASCGVPDPLEAPRGIRLRGTRRAFRARASGLELDASSGVVRLRFDLPAGSYATVLLQEIFGDLSSHRGAQEVSPRDIPKRSDDSASA